MTSSEQHAAIDGVRGFTAPGFEGLREVLAASVALDPRGGAALSALHEGELVVELSIGSGASDDTPRSETTTQTVFSCTKGVAATAILMLIERGELELDAPVARYWPEFGANGKGELLVRHVVSHMAGQPAFRAPVSADDLTDDELVESVVARDEPWWPAGTAFSYHSLTYGPLCGGLVRRITGESVGSFVQREIATPLALDVWIGLPEQREADVAPLHPVPESEQSVLTEHPAQRAQLLNPPVLYGPDTSVWNTRAYHAAEIPAAGGISSATGLARLYACLALGGTLGGRRILRPETIELGRSELSHGADVLGDHAVSRFGVGFALPVPDGPELDALAFGHGGYGGQQAGAWPSLRTGYAYFTTALRSGPIAEERANAVLLALRDALACA